ncbi:PREDICTED: drebrin-like protein isoform X2 [Chrysochloris asiatica]|uniref:Drebrin-like protein isoform X2 n=1 Tax=Chrysochloris asiatica TaxID=185453 RepID=A0A9B0WEH5_CHRAS|nr:PREDICTED: drebrin-like protein isoform X2 [Chrysochloris asiatica]
MAANLSRNGPALQEAYVRVVAEKSPTDWALFTYEGNSNDIRGACANHVSTMASFLKGAHVTINARAEEDVEPESIMQKVAKASGANYNFHKESSRFQDAGPQAPVGSVYQKTNAMSEIKRVGKDSFWAKAEKDEENRKLEDKQRAEEERRRLEQERQDRERREAARREQRYQEQERESSSQRKPEEQQEVISGARLSQASACQQPMHPRDIFRQKERAMSTTSIPSPQPGKLRSPFLQKQLTQPEITPIIREPTGSSSGPDLLRDPGPTVLESAVPVEEEAVYQEPPEQENLYEEPPLVQQEEACSEFSHYEQDAGLPGKGLCARALYDYQAADDTEISFDPENLITGIEVIDEGWWRGYGPDGHFGMFPANYVELIE